MTVIDQVRETFINVEKDSRFTTTEIKNLVHKKFGTNIGSVNPSDYSYNMTNKGKVGSLKNFNIFMQVKRGEYIYVGENYKNSDINS